jgi:hypothetical protein
MSSRYLWRLRSDHLRCGAGGHARGSIAARRTKAHRICQRHLRGAGGSFVVQPDWPGMKDRLVGVALNLKLRPHIRVASICGVLLLALAAFIKD